MKICIRAHDLGVKGTHHILQKIRELGIDGVQMVCYKAYDDIPYAIGAKIFQSICDRYLTETDGKLNLGGICLVAGLGPENNRRRDGTYEYYISEPIVENDAKGLAPFLMCYTELLQANK